MAVIMLVFMLCFLELQKFWPLSNRRLPYCVNGGPKYTEDNTAFMQSRGGAAFQNQHLEEVCDWAGTFGTKSKLLELVAASHRSLSAALTHTSIWLRTICPSTAVVWQPKPHVLGNPLRSSRSENGS